MADLSHLDEHRGYIGSSGSGKSTTARVDVEQLLREGRHTCIVDVTGIWYGLRSDRAGTGPGFDIPIFGGRRGDVAIGAGAGAAIGKIIGDGVSAIVDLSGLRSGPELREFMADFIAALRRKPPGHFQLVCDEADEYVPEKGGTRDSAHHQVAEDMIWIAKRGRTDGYVLSLITQRLADVANAAFGQVQTIFAHQLVQPDDKRAFEKYVKGKGTRAELAEIMGGLDSLQVGERYLYRPRLHVLELGKTPLPTTFDSSRTPGPGEAKREPKLLSQIDVRAIAAALKKPPAEAPIGAFDAGAEAGRLLIEKDARIRELEDRATYIEGLYLGRTSLLRDAARLLTSTAGDLEAQAQLILKVIEDDPLRPSEARLRHAGEASDAGALPPPAPSAGGGEARATGKRSDGTAGGASPTSADDGAAAPDKEYRALAVLAKVAPLGLSEAAWAGRAGYSRKGGAWQRRLTRYRQAELIEHVDGKFFATPAGLAQVGEEIPDFPAPGPELIAFWVGRLGAPGRILKRLAELYPQAFTRAGIAGEVGMTESGGAFQRHMTALKAAQVIQEVGKKKIRAAPWLTGDE